MNGKRGISMKSLCPLWIAILILLVILACAPETSPRPDLVFDPLELPTAQVDVPYEATITVSQNVTPVYWMKVVDGVLPDGLTLEYHENDSFAKINGIPTRTGTFKFVIGAACLGTSVNGQVGQKEYLIEVN
jgi:hypothetical protein